MPNHAAHQGLDREAHIEVDIQKHRWIRVREVGWALLIGWQVLSLASEFVFIVDLESRPVRLAGKVLGILGLAFVALGFERLMHIEHGHALHIGRAVRRAKKRAKRG